MIVLSHQRVVQQMSVDLLTVSEGIAQRNPTYLRLDQHQINKKHHRIMLYVFITEASAVFADCQSNPVAAGSIICAGVFGVKGLDREATFYADRHRIYVWSSIMSERGHAAKHIVVFWGRVLFKVGGGDAFRGFALSCPRGLRNRPVLPRSSPFS